jgi:uncharacterized protein with PhoU and TrkA domain
MDELDLMLLELKDTSELMIDLAYSSLLYNNREIAEEVFQMEEALDEMALEIQKKAIERAVKDADPDKAFAVIRLAQSVEEISDAARQIADVVMRDNEPHPVIALSLQESESIITSASVVESSDLSGSTLGDTKLANQCGMWVVAIKRGRKYIYGPDKTTRVFPGDLLFARGPQDGESCFRDIVTGVDRLETI